MITKLTTYFLLAAIALQGIFGGLQESVSICFGGGHEHEVAAVVEHCEFECSHHGDFVTQNTNEEHINNCDCTDFELGLITLLVNPRAQDNAKMAAPTQITFISLTAPANAQTWRDASQRDDDFGMMQRIAVIRATRLRI